MQQKQSYIPLLNNNFSFLGFYYILINLGFVKKVHDKCICWTAGNKYFIGDIVQKVYKVLFCPFYRLYLLPISPKSSFSAGCVNGSGSLSHSCIPSTQKHYNYFHFSIFRGHRTSVNNHLSPWTSLYLYISDPITIGSLEVYFIFILVLLVLF